MVERSAALRQDCAGQTRAEELLAVGTRVLAAGRAGRGCGPGRGALSVENMAQTTFPESPGAV